MVAEFVCRGVAEHDGCGDEIEGVVHCLDRDVREVDQHAQTVHLTNNILDTKIVIHFGRV